MIVKTNLYDMVLDQYVRGIFVNRINYYKTNLNFMGNFGCFETDQSLVSLKVRPVDEKTEEDKRIMLSKLPEEQLKKLMYLEYSKIQDIIKQDLFSSKATKQSRNKALEMIFQRWNELSLILQHTRQAEVNRELEESERNIKRIRQADAIQMEMVKEIKDLKTELEKITKQNQRLTSEYNNYKEKFELKQKQHKSALESIQNVHKQKNKALNDELLILRQEADQLKQKYSSIQEKHSRYTQQADGKEDKIKKYEEEIRTMKELQEKKQGYIQNYQVEIAKSKEQLEKAQYDLNLSQNQLLKMRETKDEELRTREQQYKQLELGLDSSNEKIEELKYQLLQKTQTLDLMLVKQKQEENQYKIELESKNNQIDQLRVQIDRKTRQSQQHSERMQALQLQIQSKNQQLFTLKKQNGKLHGDAQYQHAIQQNNILKDKIQQMQVKINELIAEESTQLETMNKQFQSTLASTEQKIKEQMNSHIEEQVKRNQKLKQEVAWLRKENEELKNNQKDVDEEMVTKLVNDVKGLKQEKEEIQRQLDKASEDKIAAMNNMMTQLENYKNNLGKTNESILEKNKKISTLESKVDSLEKQLKEKVNIVQKEQKQEKEVFENDQNTNKLELEDVKSKLIQTTTQNQELTNKLNESKSNIQLIGIELSNLKADKNNLLTQIQQLKNNNIQSNTQQLSTQLQEKQNQILLQQQQIRKLTLSIDLTEEEIHQLRWSLKSSQQTIIKLEEQKSGFESQSYFYIINLTILPMSEVVQDFNEKQEFKALFAPLNLSNSKLIYRATERQFMGFNEMCDNRENVVLIMRANNRTFGCYLQSGFGVNTTVNENRQSFLFSLTQRTKIGVKEGKALQTNSKSSGPTVGKDLIINGNVGISTVGDMFDATSIAEADTFLAGEGKFQIEEYEVYMLWFS